MTLRPRRQHAASDAHHGDPPRLVLRFAAWTAIGLALAAAAILLVVRHFNTVQAERGAATQSRVVASTVLRGVVRRSDFETPVGGKRLGELDRLVQNRVLSEGFLLVNFYSADGRITYSTDHARIGARTAESVHLTEARRGLVRGDVSSVETRKALRSYAPVAVERGTGIVALFQDYAPIARAAKATFLPVVGIFEVVLIVLLVALGPILRRVTTRIKRQMAEIERRAFYDELTGLPNRSLFRDRVEEAIAVSARDGRPSSVMLLDIDAFKRVNDALGHAAGDQLLDQAAARLSAAVRAGETCARLGGDEFGFLLPGGSTEDALALAERVHGALAEPFVLADVPVEAAASIGVVTYPQHGDDAEALLQRADVAMYLAKEARASTAVYEAERDDNDAARLALAAELRTAIEEGQLLLHYQPKAALDSGRIVGAEALVRWDHPDRGLVPPSDFIPVAEQTGLIKPLSRYVVATAVRQCAEWNAAGHDVEISVNLTIPDLLDLDLPDRIAAELAEHKVRPDQLELEITETTILADPFRVRTVLTRLNEMGLRLAIDDFGTGYSSLAYLKRLPVQTIKIDRSFVMDMCSDANDATIVRSTIGLAKNLGLAVVAEGVETQEAWDALRADGCTLAQGYLIAKPLAAGDFEALLSEPRAAVA